MHRSPISLGLLPLLVASLSLDSFAQQHTWTLNGTLADVATNALPNLALTLDVDAYDGTDGFGPVDWVSLAPVPNSPTPTLLGKAIRLHENDSTGRLQRLRASSDVFGTPPNYASNWTLSMWFNRADHDNEDWLLFTGYGDGGGGGGAEFEILCTATGTIQARAWGPTVNDASPIEMWIESDALPSQTWHHMAFVFANDNTGILYVNGELVDLDLNVSPDAALNRSFDGYLDQSQIFTNAMTTSEVLALYNLGRSAPRITALDVTNGGARVTFQPFAGARYQLQATDSIAANWTDLSSPSTGMAETVQHIATTNVPGQQLYRLKLLTQP